jgi:hypothetical protein
MSKNRFELGFGLSAIAIGGALAWGIAHYRDFQVAWYRQQFIKANRNVCYQYIQRLAALGPVADSCLAQIVVVPEHLPRECVTISHHDWARVVVQIRNDRRVRVCLLAPMERDERAKFEESPSVWINTMESDLQRNTVLDPGEALPWDCVPGPPEPVVRVRP